MAVLSANAVNPPRHLPGSAKFEASYPANAADEYYLGAIVCHTGGRLVASNADIDTTVGICMQRTTITAQDQPVKVHVKGVWWIAAGGMALADLWTLCAPTAASDNPADLINLAAGTPSALGTIIHVDVAGTSGWVDLDQRVVVVNT